MLGQVAGVGERLGAVGALVGLDLRVVAMTTGGSGQERERERERLTGFSISSRGLDLLSMAVITL